MQFSTRIQVFTGDSVWHKPANLVHIVLVIRSGGGGGSSAGYGGGGGSAVQSDRIYAAQLPDLVEVTVGTGGAGWQASTGRVEEPGGESRFLDYVLSGGGPGTREAGGLGALAPMRGGSGSPPGVAGQSVHALPITMLSGGGGGAGRGMRGGGSGLTSPDSASVLWPYTHQSGPGGSGTGTTSPHGMYPAGGGAGYLPDLAGAGAAGCVTVIETLYEEVLTL